MSLQKLWTSIYGERHELSGSGKALLREILRGTPPEEPQRMYRRTRDGEWQRRRGAEGFRKVKAGILIGRICHFNHRNS